MDFKVFDTTIIEGKRIYLTELASDMAEDIMENSLDDDNRSYVPDEVFETIEQAKKVVDWLIDASKTPTGPFLYPVIRKEDGANMGYVQCVEIEDGYEIGYHIAREYTNRGYATEAVRVFLPWIMEKLGVEKIAGIVVEENHASHKVLEKCGFELEFKGEGMYQGKMRPIRIYWYKA